MKKLLLLPFLALTLALPVFAQPVNGTAAEPAGMAEGEVRKVDKDTKRITIRHGEIKNLDMPGMTMLFQVKDPAMLDLVKPGDKVKFKAERAGGSIVLTEIQVAN